MRGTPKFEGGPRNRAGFGGRTPGNVMVEGPSQVEKTMESPVWGGGEQGSPTAWSYGGGGPQFMEGTPKFEGGPRNQAGFGDRTAGNVMVEGSSQLEKSAESPVWGGGHQGVPQLGVMEEGDHNL